jgi:hypothetical protein
MVGIVIGLETKEGLIEDSVEDVSSLVKAGVWETADDNGDFSVGYKEGPQGDCT